MRLLGPASGRIGTAEHGTALRCVKLMMEGDGERSSEDVLFEVWNWINRKRQVRSERDGISSSSWAGKN